MKTLEYLYRHSDGWWLGYLRGFPDYWTQGESLDDLRDHLRSLLADIESGCLDLPAR